MGETPDVEALKGFNASVVEEFRVNGGKVGGNFAGAAMVLLTTTGAKSGKQRLTPLVYQTVDDTMIIIGSYRGADIDPAWVHNLRAHPRAHVEVGTESYDVTARELPPAQRDPAWVQIVAAAPRFGEYQAETSRVIPLFELSRDS
jgi:deazaflavin-dependent oxidoreductase (nitroreductase family)